jgi:hypothetical protein
MELNSVFISLIIFGAVVLWLVLSWYCCSDDYLNDRGWEEARARRAARRADGQRFNGLTSQPPPPPPPLPASPFPPPAPKPAYIPSAYQHRLVTTSQQGGPANVADSRRKNFPGRESQFRKHECRCGRRNRRSVRVFNRLSIVCRIEYRMYKCLRSVEFVIPLQTRLAFPSDTASKAFSFANALYSSLRLYCRYNMVLEVNTMTNSRIHHKRLEKTPHVSKLPSLGDADGAPPPPPTHVFPFQYQYRVPSEIYDLPRERAVTASHRKRIRASRRQEIRGLFAIC